MQLHEIVEKRKAALCMEICFISCLIAPDRPNSWQLVSVVLADGGASPSLPLEASVFDLITTVLY